MHRILVVTNILSFFGIFLADMLNLMAVKLAVCSHCCLLAVKNYRHTNFTASSHCCPLPAVNSHCFPMLAVNVHTAAHCHQRTVTAAMQCSARVHACVLKYTYTIWQALLCLYVSRNPFRREQWTVTAVTTNRYCCVRVRACVYVFVAGILRNHALWQWNVLLLALSNYCK